MLIILVILFSIFSFSTLILYSKSPAFRIFITKLKGLDAELTFFSKNKNYTKLCTLHLYFSSFSAAAIIFLVCFKMLVWVDIILCICLFLSLVVLSFVIGDLLIQIFLLCTKYRSLVLEYSKLLLLCSLLKTLIKFIFGTSSGLFIVFLIYDIFIKNFLAVDTGFCLYRFSPLLGLIFLMQNVITWDQFIYMVSNPYEAIIFFAERRINFKKELVEKAILQIESKEFVTPSIIQEKKNCRKAFYLLDQEKLRLNKIKEIIKNKNMIFFF